MPLVLLPVLALAVAIEGGPFWETLRDSSTLSNVTPAALLYLNLTLGSLVLVTWFVMRFVHRMRPRWLASVRPRIRWRYLAACVGLSVIALVAQIVVANLVPGNTDGMDSATLNHFTPTSLALGLVILLTTPLQAAGEEYAFRGYLLQAFGSFSRNRPLALLATATLFALAHGTQNFPLFFDRFMFGLIAGYLVMRTGGLEAGIAMHILNNFLAFGYALAFGNMTDSLSVSSASWWNLPVTLTQSGVYLVLALWMARRMGLDTHTKPPLETAAAAQDEASAAVE